MIDEIRRLRANVLPRGVAARLGWQAGPQRWLEAPVFDGRIPGVAGRFLTGETVAAAWWRFSKSIRSTATQVYMDGLLAWETCVATACALLQMASLSATCRVEIQWLEKVTSVLPWVVKPDFSTKKIVRVKKRLLLEARTAINANLSKSHLAS